MACNQSSIETYEYLLPNASHEGDSRVPPPPATLRMSLAVLMMLTVVAGFLGNAAVCIIVYRRPAMRSAINLLLATLAFSDIMLCLCCLPCCCFLFTSVSQENCLPWAAGTATRGNVKTCTRHCSAGASPAEGNNSSFCFILILSDQTKPNQAPTS